MCVSKCSVKCPRCGAPYESLLYRVKERSLDVAVVVWRCPNCRIEWTTTETCTDDCDTCPFAEKER